VSTLFFGVLRFLSCCVVWLVVMRYKSRVLVCAVRASSAAAHGHEHHPSDLEVAQKFHNTLNDIPVPQGSWQEHYDKRNAKWSKLLGASIVVFAGSLYAVCILFFKVIACVSEHSIVFYVSAGQNWLVEAYCSH